jgi:hypothetical protein
MSGTKNDAEKTMFQLLTWTFIEDIAKVMTFGAVKYGDYNWQQGIKTSRLWGAVFRHLVAVLKGETEDKESGISHLAHAACNLMFLYWMMRERPDLDDQPCDLPD